MHTQDAEHVEHHLGRSPACAAGELFEVSGWKEARELLLLLLLLLMLRRRRSKRELERPVNGRMRAISRNGGEASTRDSSGAKTNKKYDAEAVLRRCWLQRLAFP